MSSSRYRARDDARAGGKPSASSPVPAGHRYGSTMTSQDRAVRSFLERTLERMVINADVDQDSLSRDLAVGPLLTLYAQEFIQTITAAACESARLRDSPVDVSDFVAAMAHNPSWLAAVHEIQAQYDDVLQDLHRTHQYISSKQR